MQMKNFVLSLFILIIILLLVFGIFFAICFTSNHVQNKRQCEDYKYQILLQDNVLKSREKLDESKVTNIMCEDFRRSFYDIELNYIKLLDFKCLEKSNNKYLSIMNKYKVKYYECMSLNADKIAPSRVELIPSEVDVDEMGCEPLYSTSKNVELFFNRYIYKGIRMKSYRNRSFNYNKLLKKYINNCDEIKKEYKRRILK